MSENDKEKAGLQKGISSIFKVVPTPETDGGQKPIGTSSAEHPGYIERKPTAPEVQKPRASNAYQAMQSLLKIDPENIVYDEPKQPTPEPQRPQASKTNQVTPSLPKAAPAQQPKAAPAQQPKAVPAQQPKAVPAQQSKAAPARQPKAIPVRQDKVIPVRQPKVVLSQRLNTIQTRRRLMIAGIIWAACFVVFLFAYIFVLGPQRDYKRSIENKLAEKQKVYESALRASREETKIELNKQIAHLQGRLKDFVIDFEDSANLTFDISQIASEKQVASFSIKSRDSRGLSTIPDCKYICENQINISFTGGFSQFAAFLNALERHRPVLFINKFTITRLQEEDSGYQVSLNVAALVRKQQSEGLHSEDGKSADGGSMKLYGMKI